MKEAFLHFVWNTRSFDQTEFRTTDGKSVEILNYGEANAHGGPDFKHAQIVVDGTRWAGNVEIHVLASEWEQHGHSDDPNYESVILHVVLEEDKVIYLRQRRLPCVELKNRIRPGLLASYRRLLESRTWVPCANHLPAIPKIKKETWLSRMMIGRMEAKSAAVEKLLDDTKHDWHAVLMRLLFAAFGFGANRAAFERLGRLVSWRQIFQHRNEPERIEAMLFGCAGMLNRIFIDAYPIRLQAEFFHLARKYDLRSMQARAWEWGHVRPANFPTIRIAQLAGLVVGHDDLLQVICQATKIQDLQQVFRVRVSGYWQGHSDFDRAAKQRPGHLGKQSITVILVNAIVPFLFCYGRQTGNEAISVRAVNFMADMKPEINHLTKRWTSIGLPNRHAGDSQALIHLKRNYCDQFRCISCTIGQYLLKNTDQDADV